MDSNLWASIVTRIFEELNIYITNNTNTDNERKLVEDKLTSHLSIAKEEIGNFKNEKNILSDQILKLKSKKRNLERQIVLNIQKIQKNTIWDVVKNINEQFDAEKQIANSVTNNETFIQSKEDLKKIIPQKYWNDPQKSYQLIKSRNTFLKEFFRKDKIFTNILWLSIIIILIVFVPFILQLISKKISKINFLIPQATLSILITAGAVWRRGESVYNKLQPVIASFWKIKEKYEKQISEAKANFEQEEKVIKLKIEKNKSEILLISEQIQKAEIIKTDLEFRINNALTTETLYSFIDKRSKSNDYQKHLGIISIIRKDFEILNDLFIGHNEEFNKTTNIEEFKNKFTKPLERIILYIDDLDRCQEENVVQVLEAVNLLMAFPLFVVVVGVDSRWVKNALHQKHSKQFNINNSKSTEEILQVSNYLEKIFQIPFHLKEANDTNVKDMIKNLAQHIVENPTNILPETVQNTINVDHDENKTNHIININSNYEKTLESSLEHNNPSSSDSKEFETENLVLTDNEIGLMQEMSEIIGTNPRCIKRFVNTLRIIKAHGEFDYSADDSNQEIIAILFLIALPLGKYKNLVPTFESFIHKEYNNFEKLEHYFQLTQITDDESLTRDELFKILSNKTPQILLNMPTNIFRNHNKFIRRFTFSKL